MNVEKHAPFSLKKLKFLGKLSNGATPSSSDPGNWEGDIVWVTPDDLGQLDGRYLSDSRRKITQDGYESCGTKIIPQGSLVLSTRAPIGHLAILSVAACFNQGCKGFSPNELIIPEYAFYWLLSHKTDLQVLGLGTTFVELSRHSLANYEIGAPSIEIQRQIISYLDKRCAEIDDLIAKKRKLLKLLAEKRSALITRAVTKGLDPNAPMKPSGIDWLGDIPAHWDAPYRLKFLTTVSGGLTPSTSNADYWRGDIPWVSPKDMKVFDISDSEDKITELALAETSLNVIQPDAVLFVVRGMILAHTFPIAVNSVPVTINQDMKALRCDDRLLPKYLACFLKGVDRHILSLVETSAHGTKALRSESWRELYVPLPTIDEQQKLLSAIDEGTADIDKSASLVQRAIDQLSEYRAAIITKAVTGELEVT
jgi:type I restriction enzyme S subunit